MFSIEIADCQRALKFDEPRIKRVVESILRDAGVVEAELSIAVVDDPAIHELNRTHLQHDYPTDVLSFALERSEQRLEGEVVVSSDTAIRTAGRVGWGPDDELLLYVIHGTLHLVGHDDGTPQLRAAMRAEEKRYLATVGLDWREEPPTAESPATEN